MAEQLPIEPLTSEKRASLSDSLVAMLLSRRHIEAEKKVLVSRHNKDLKDLDRDIYELTKLLNVPPAVPEELTYTPLDDAGLAEVKADIQNPDSDLYKSDHQARAGIETVEVTGDDLDSELKVLDEELGF